MSSSVPGYDWCNPEPYAALQRYGRSGLAWELLRRNSGYREAVGEQRVVSPAAIGGLQMLPTADPAFVARWGLHFRRGSRPRRV